MSGNIIRQQFKLLRFAILPGILGGIACFIGPPHSPSIKAMIGVIIGCAIQHRFMAQGSSKSIMTKNGALQVQASSQILLGFSFYTNW